MNPSAKWVIEVLCAASVTVALTVLIKALRGVLHVLHQIHTYVVVHFGEHDLMCEDYCIRRNISRHNMRGMAIALAKVEDAGMPNGRAKGKGQHGA